MARIKMKNTQNETVKELFSLFISNSSAKGLKEKTIKTYQQHFNSVSKRLNVEIPVSRLKKADLDRMISVLRKESLSDQSILLASIKGISKLEVWSR